MDTCELSRDREQTLEAMMTRDAYSAVLCIEIGLRAELKRAQRCRNRSDTRRCDTCER